MLKYFKEGIAKYEFADYLQTFSLLLFVLFFIILIWYVFTKPKGYYKHMSELPLENDSSDLEEPNTENT